MVKNIEAGDVNDNKLDCDDTMQGDQHENRNEKNNSQTCYKNGQAERGSGNKQSGDRNNHSHKGDPRW